MRTREEEREFLKRTLETFERMTDEEKKQTLIDAGIIDEDGDLAEKYKPEEDSQDS